MTEPITTTLNKIRKHSPCEEGWKKLCKSLGGIRKYGGDTPIKFSHIIESNGLFDTLWCLRSVYPEYEKEARLFAADCAERVLHLYEKEYPDDSRIRDCIKAAKDFANSKITKGELATARDAAGDAWIAACSARDVCAARAAYTDRDAWTAARAAYAAADAARAACAVACAAGDADGDVWDAWTAAYSAIWAAGDSEKEIQKQILIKRLG